MNAVTLPAGKNVKELLEQLLGKDVEVSVDNRWLLAPGMKVVAGEFRDDLDTLAACVAVDLSLGIYLGAAVGLLPPGGAQDMAKDGELTKTVAENLYEVFNVISGLLNQASVTHVRLGAMVEPGQPLAEEVTRWLSAPGVRLDLTVVVPGYGEGHLVLAAG